MAVELLTCCGECSHYGNCHCDNKNSSHYKSFQYSNVVWNCSDFDGVKTKWDNDKAVPVGYRPSTFH